MTNAGDDLVKVGRYRVRNNLSYWPRDRLSRGFFVSGGGFFVSVGPALMGFLLLWSIEIVLKTSCSFMQ